ncbi:MAG TPA: glycosyltransferase, partial [Candidatus Dormibacteraeota bacterium]|nr:glycosyltransferase [Candidatus Dormibacteraeota bacterium]
MRRFVFVLEQTLGHVAHGRNLERALAARNTIEPTIIRIPYSTPSGLGSIPLARNWSVRASVAARRALKGISGPVEAAFIHTQVASLLSTGFMSRTPTVVSLDATPVNFDTEGEAYGHHRTAPAVEWLKREFNLRPLRSAACLVTWCQWAADSLVRDYGLDAAKIQVVHPGVDLSIFKPGDRSHGGDPVRVLFVGGDFIRKGGLELLNAARGLEEKIALEIVTNDAVEVPPGLTVNIHRGLAPQSEGLVRLFRESDL